MNPADALRKARQAGITITLVEDGDLSLQAAEEPPADVIKALRQHKSEIVELLRKPAAATSMPQIVKQESYGSAGVPECYRSTWEALQFQCPAEIPEPQWRQALDDAARFFGEWGGLAVLFGWKLGDIFDYPSKDTSGLIWWLRGRETVALGPEHCIVERPGGPAFDRITRQDWVRQFVGSANLVDFPGRTSR
jgi:hypothetical protein